MFRILNDLVLPPVERTPAPATPPPADPAPASTCMSAGASIDPYLGWIIGAVAAVAVIAAVLIIVAQRRKAKAR